MPSASERTGAYRGSVGANAIRAPRNVGFSVMITSPALITSFAARSRPC